MVTGRQALRLHSLNQLNKKANVLVTGDQVAHHFVSVITTGAISAPF